MRPFPISNTRIFAHVLVALVGMAAVAACGGKAALRADGVKEGWPAGTGRAASARVSPTLGDLHFVGKGMDGFVATGADGSIHVTYDGKYRAGPSIATLGPEERVTSLPQFSNARMTVAGNGQPHLVFTVGRWSDFPTRNSYYTTRVAGRWLPPEKLGDPKQYSNVADVAADERGNVVACFWTERPEEHHKDFNVPSFRYVWRTPDGKWGPLQHLPADWSSTPKVEYRPGIGFYLLWQRNTVDWRVAGPVAAGKTFSEEGSRATASANLPGVGLTQNEGGDLHVARSGRIVAVGNVREVSDGPCGVWASIDDGGPKDPIGAYLGTFPGTVGGDESGVHPVPTVDEATGDVVVSALNPVDQLAYFGYWRQGVGWLPGTLGAGLQYSALLPDRNGPQGTLRQAPSVTDVPGPGVVALVRDGSQNFYLRHIVPPSARPKVDLATTRRLPRLGPPVLVGRGLDGFVATDEAGTVHVVYGGRYRTGRSADTLGPEERVTDLPGPHTFRMTVAAGGQAHLVFTTGRYRGKTKGGYYTARVGARWLPVELFADPSEIGFMADVAADEKGNVLACSWTGRFGGPNDEKRGPDLVYRWRKPDGRWGSPQSFPTSGTGSPRVEYRPGVGFFLLRHHPRESWRVAGPVAAGGTFKEQDSRAAGSGWLTDPRAQGEGADLHVTSSGLMVTVGSVREDGKGRYGIWTSVDTGGTERAQRAYLGTFPGATSSDRVIHPAAAVDAATGDIVVTALSPADTMAYQAYWKRGTGWLPGTVAASASYVPLLPDAAAPQGNFRQGPSVADTPGPGVVILVRDGSGNFYLRSLLPPPSE